MTRLMITCPITQKPAFAGIDVPAQVWETMQMANNTIRCEHCGQSHVWDKDDAYFDIGE